MSGGITSEALAWLFAQPRHTWVDVRELERRGILQAGELERLEAAGLRVRRGVRKARARRQVRVDRFIRAALGRAVKLSVMRQAGASAQEIQAKIEAMSPDEYEQLLEEIVRLEGEEAEPFGGSSGAPFGVH